jgi:sodium-dependent dicarboxylate transporter 2/3/5
MIRHVKNGVVTTYDLARSVPLISLCVSTTLAVLIYAMTSDFDLAQRGTLAVAGFMISAWVLEAIPFGAVALVPALALPLLGVANLKTVANSYATPTVALFFGGFLLASAIERSRLHERIAHLLLVRTRLGPKRSLLGVLLISGLLSMWISNTSTAIMIIPLAIALGRRLSLSHSKQDLGVAFALAAAYGASLGGTATILGSPPNGLLAGAVNARGLEPLSFLEWMQQMLPLWFILVPVAWVVLLVVFRKSFLRLAKDVAAHPEQQVESAPLPDLSPREKRVAGVFVLAVGLWCFLPFVPQFAPVRGEIDAIVALFIGLVLFVLPAGGGKDQTLLHWEDTKGVAWNVLLLFGGGLALSEAFQSSGLSTELAGYLGRAGLDGSPLAVAGLVAGMLFATEVVSNTALAATVIPILLELEVTQGLDPLALALPATIAVSLAFMMPIATPPNAIAYGMGRVPLSKMLFTGFFLNILCVVMLVWWFSS